MTSSFRRKVLAYGFVAGFATCVAAGVLDVNAGAVQLDPTDDPAIRTTLKEFQEAKDRNLDYLLEACPSACTDFQSTPEWFLYSDAARLARCNETMLLDLSISHDLKSKDDPIGIRACKANYEASRKVAQSLDTASVCTTANHLQVDIPIKLSSKGSAGLPIAGALAAAHQIESYVSAQSIMCDNNTISFGYSDGSIIGLYSGKEIHQQGITAQVLSQFQDYLQKGDVPEAVVAQLCNSDGRGADYAIGIAASLSGDLAFVQNAVKSWNNGECVTGVKEVSILARLRFNVPDIHLASNGTRNGTDSWSISTQTNVFRPRLAARADCRTTNVQAGDGCYTVAQRCGISQSDLTKYNTRSNFCGTLAAGETVCCSSGTLPVTTLPPKADGTCQTRTIVAGDECSSLAAKCGITTAEFTQFNPDPKLCSSLAVGGFVCCGRGTRPDNRPKQNSDGSCFVYQTKTDDGCYSTAAAHGLTLEEIEELNQDTWGWNGCDQPLYVGVYMCLSTGTPPMPAPVANAVCGPTVPGTLTPPSGTNISTLNPWYVYVVPWNQL